jgi:hypothetical protein
MVADGPFVTSDATDSTPIDASIADAAVSEATSNDGPAIDGAGPYVDPLAGAVGCPDGGFPTSRGAWFDEGNTYYLVSGRGSCSAPAYADTDAGAITVGDFSFANVIYP